MKFNKYEQENYELSNAKNTPINIKVSFGRKIVKIISKILAIGWIVFIGGRIFEGGSDRLYYTYIGFRVGAFTGLIFPAIIYLILSSSLYKSFKEKHLKLNTIKMMIVSLGIFIIINLIADSILTGHINGIENLLIISIPEIFIIWVIDIILNLRKRKLNKYLEKDSYVETKCDYENSEISSMEKILSKCNKCGYENKEGAKFCNQCGSKIEENQNREFGMMQEDKRTLLNLVVGRNKKKSIIVLILVVISVICYIGYFNYGIGMSEQQKNDRINALVSAKKYNEARSMNDIYFKGTDKVTTLTHDLHKNVIDTCEITNTGNLADATDKYNQLKNTVKIIKTEIVNFKYSTNYQNIKVTVQNNGKENLNYVKIGLDFKDKNGNVIKSDWTNSDSVIKPGATQTLEKMVSKDVKYDTVQSEVLDFK